MNTEKLHVVALALQKEFRKRQTAEHLKSVIDALQGQINQPQNAQYVNQVSAHLNNLRSALRNSPSDEFFPGWRQVLSDMGIEGLLGSNLLKKIDEIFSRNQITPATARDELSPLYSRLNEVRGAIDGIVGGFSTLQIGKEELSPGSCELGVLIPREAIGNELSRFIRHTSDFDKIVKTFSEVVTGSRPQVQIRSIASTDLSIFLDLAPEVCACLAVAVERIVALYKSVLEIRLLKSQLEQQNVPEQALEGITEHANNTMSNGIDELTKELIDQNEAAEKTPGRKNELTIGLRFALKQIAYHIDHGVKVEIRVAPLPAPADDASEEEKEETNAKNEILMAIGESSKTLLYSEVHGKGILNLPKKEKAGDDNSQANEQSEEM